MISCDYKSLNHIPKANSDLIVHTIAEIHSIDYEDLLECLRAHPEYGETFFQRLEVSYSLQECDNVSLSPSFIDACIQKYTCSLISDSMHRNWIFFWSF